MKWRKTAWLGVGVLSLGLCGCSTFERDWRAGMAMPAPDDPAAGLWEGEWRSESNDHHGRLRAIVDPIDSESYRARFRAGFWKIFHWTYAVDLRVNSRTNGAVSFAGSENLGALAGGVYECAGQADGETFRAHYHSRLDTGQFSMQR